MPTLVLLWVWCCAYLNCAGWALSALHQLNAGGYAVAITLGVMMLCVWRKKTSPEIFPAIRWQKRLRRFRKPFPLAFLVLATLAFLGGLIHAPTNYDALAYRVPRVLHWLAADQWHWIHSIFERINTRACGIEWVSAPLIALLKTDRVLFLINIISLLLLPGLVFSVFTRLGVRARVAWHWMWLAPTGYCFLLQAGSIGNDLFGAPFALAAVDFALRTKVSRAPRDFFAALLAAALMTSAKTASLPLLLPWAVALLPSLKLILRWPLRTAAIGVIAIFASALPTMIFNVVHAHSWSGANLNHAGAVQAIALRTGGSVVSLATQNLVPPVFPVAKKWNDAVLKHMPESLETSLKTVMLETQAYEFSVPEMQMEENAGLGFGVSALLLASVLAAGLVRKSRSENSSLVAADVSRLKFPIETNGQAGAKSIWQSCVRWAPVISLLALMTQYNLSCFGRILAPYYLLLLPVLLAGAGQEKLVCQHWWRVAALMVFLMAGGLLVISPARPLFPVQILLAKADAQGSSSRALTRLKEVYQVYSQRNDGFAPARDLLPPGLKVLGMVTYDDPETSLWHPFGARRIEHVCPQDTAADLKARGIEYILLREDTLNSWFGSSLEDWLKQMNATAVRQFPLNLRAARGPLDWYLVKLN